MSEVKQDQLDALLALNLRNVNHELAYVRGKWYDIGVQLDLSDTKLHEIEADYHFMHRRFSEVINFWLKGNTLIPVTWESLIDALESPPVNERGLAKELREKLGLHKNTDTSISHEVPSNAHTENQPIEQLDSQTTGVQPIGQIDSQTTGVQPIGQPDIQTTGVGQPNLGSPTTIVQPREKGGSTTSWCRISYRGRFIQCHTNTMCLFFSQVFLIGFAIVAVFAIDQRAFLVGKVTQDQNPTIPSIYSPGDSRLIPLTFSSRILHNMIWFEVTGHDICSSATMYLVEEYKYLPLKYNNTVQIKKPYTVHNNTFRYWMFYLHPQSEINGTICPSTPLEAFIIKGKTNFMLWRDLRAPEYADVHFNCTDNGIKTGYKISEKDYYFIVVLNRRNMQQVEIVSDLNITRFGYVTMDPYQNCTSLPFNPCALSIPFDLVTQYNVLITTSIPAHEVNWENEIDIKIYYRYRIPIVFLFICYAIFNFAVLFCYCF